MDSWNKEMGFDLPIIIEACNRGIAQHPNDVTFAYVNGILKRWKKQGVKSIDDIEQEKIITESKPIYCQAKCI